MVPRTGSGAKRFAYGNRWQYHSRSDHHSKLVCWLTLLDLLLECPTLRVHAERGVVGFGINHKMRGFGTDREKALDLVICRPRSDSSVGGAFAELASGYGVSLDAELRDRLSALPTLHQREVGAVHLALEAKACMTAHQKALPRLYDELNSSHQAIHNASPHAIAAGIAIVNMAEEFVSPDLNKWNLSERHPKVSRHRQPQWTQQVLEKLAQMPRRTTDREAGFDAFGVFVVDLRNDGSLVSLIERPPAPQPGDNYHYVSFIQRLGHLYEQRFGGL
jgi:hypothetical protein